MEKRRLYYLMIFVLTLSVYACRKSANNQPLSITGTWTAQYGAQNKQVYQDVYKFNADSSFTQTRQLADSASGKPISYQYLGTGKFHLNADNLVLYDVIAKASSNYGPFDQLTVIEQLTSTTRYTIALNADATTFHFVFPPCPINASCLGTLTYYKK